MKVKDLIEQLSGFEDFEVEIMVGCPDRFNYHSYNEVEIADIGHSDKVILLTGKWRE